MAPASCGSKEGVRLGTDRGMRSEGSRTTTWRMLLAQTGELSKLKGDLVYGWELTWQSQCESRIFPEMKRSWWEVLGSSPSQHGGKDNCGCFVP